MEIFLIMKQIVKFLCPNLCRSCEFVLYLDLFDSKPAHIVEVSFEFETGYLTVKFTAFFFYFSLAFLLCSSKDGQKLSRCKLEELFRASEWACRFWQRLLSTSICRLGLHIGKVSPGTLFWLRFSAISLLFSLFCRPFSFFATTSGNVHFLSPFLWLLFCRDVAVAAAANLNSFTLLGRMSFNVVSQPLPTRCFSLHFRYAFFTLF